MFLPLGGEPCVLVLGLPSEGDKPDPATFRAFRVNAGDGAIIHLGARPALPTAVCCLCVRVCACVCVHSGGCNSSIAVLQ